MVEHTIYVACHQCDNCGHIGINDAAGDDGRCAHCDWSGPYPDDDTCPSCARSSCIEEICPRCAGPYHMLLEDELDADGKPGANRITMAEFGAAEAEYLSWVPRGVSGGQHQGVGPSDVADRKDAP